MGEDETIASYRIRLLDLANEAKSLGSSMSNLDLVNKVLRSLPDKFFDKVVCIETANDTCRIALDDLMASLELFEINLNREKLEREKSSSKLESNWKNLDSVRCRACTGFGHYANECANTLKRQ